MDDEIEVGPQLSSETDADAHVREVLGMFDVPSFARRGHDLESAIARLDDRCRRERTQRLEMVHMRLRQWAQVVSGPGGWAGVFTAPLGALYLAAGAPEPTWAAATASLRRRKAAANDLVASVERFNRRWLRFMDELNLGPVNRLVEEYNRCYLIEKECVLGSPRLAARLFEPAEPVTLESLLFRHPPLPVPELARA